MKYLTPNTSKYDFANSSENYIYYQECKLNCDHLECLQVHGFIFPRQISSCKIVPQLESPTEFKDYRILINGDEVIIDYLLIHIGIYVISSVGIYKVAKATSYRNVLCVIQ